MVEQLDQFKAATRVSMRLNASHCYGRALNDATIFGTTRLNTKTRVLSHAACIFRVSTPRFRALATGMFIFIRIVISDLILNVTGRHILIAPKGAPRYPGLPLERESRDGESWQCEWLSITFNLLPIQKIRM